MLPLEPLLHILAAWAANRSGIVGLALVGSYARGTARAGSDIDLVLLAGEPDAFRASSAWLAEIDWSSLGLSVDSYRDAQYGVVWSRHVKLSDGTPIEFSFAHPNWAATTPCDPGTRSVVSGGCRILFDPARLLQCVVSCAA